MKKESWLNKIWGYLPGRYTPDRAEWPEWYTSYADASAADRPPGKSLLSSARILVIDAETTGLDYRKDRLISLGGLRLSGSTIYVADHFEAYLPTPTELSAESAVSIHGIVPNSSRYVYDTEAELLRRLLLFLGPQGIIVGHHIGFDVAMINMALGRQGAGPLLNKVVDTGGLAERLQPAGYWTPPEKFSLDNLARRYRIPLSDRHTALGDAYITAVLWLKLTARLSDKLGRELTVEDVAG
ncbi:3'-5' exonuclease [Neolewinella aurantiaca]|uniref:3'-5' exonuclease n=1 Tax=Neolewinella aurantiaca TaxID=2602767 RepID=A0A5C7FNN3_9BACT|nr:3'-5' exonuclease [Neolewinella aurantiaca]TXF88022.1 3'-5' exonuclease [Neolewinella aurantiaca]